MKALITLLRISVSSAFILAVSNAAQADPITWTWNKPKPPTGEGENTAWMNPDNWDSEGKNPEAGIIVPRAGDIANINIALQAPITVSFDSTPIVGTLNVGDSGSGNHTISFAGGQTRILTLDAGANEARINKTSGNSVTFLRSLSFASNAVLSVEGGAFTVSGDAARLLGNGSLAVEGTGVATFASNATSTQFSTLFNGDLSVRSDGTLLINNTFNASTTASAATVTVENSGRLGGVGTVERATTVTSGGILTPGATLGAAGVMKFANGLTLDDGSVFAFELRTQSVTGRGSSFDGVDITGGNFIIDAGALFDVTFDSNGSSIDFTSEFWKSEQEWLVFQSASTPNGLFTLGSVSNDSQGNAFATTGGVLGFKQVGNDIFLTYSPIPEPGSTAMLLGCVVATLVTLRNRAINGSLKR